MLCTPQAKALQDRRDVRAYTKPVKVQPQPGAAAGGDGVPSWNNAKLQVGAGAGAGAVWRQQGIGWSTDVSPAALPGWRGHSRACG